MSPIATIVAARHSVAVAVDTFIAHANAHCPAGHTFTAEPSGAKYRIVHRYNGTGASVHAFVDGDTGNLLKAAGWNAAAKGVRYNLLTELDAVLTNFDWSGGYLYAGAREAAYAAAVHQLLIQWSNGSPVRYPAAKWLAAQFAAGVTFDAAALKVYYGQDRPAATEVVFEEIDESITYHGGYTDYDDKRIEFDNMNCHACGNPVGPRIGEDPYTGHPTSESSPAFAVAAGFLCEDCLDVLVPS